jgi:hypothetical protein
MAESTAMLKASTGAISIDEGVIRADERDLWEAQSPSSGWTGESPAGGPPASLSRRAICARSSRSI